MEENTSTKLTIEQKYLDVISKITAIIHDYEQNMPGYCKNYTSEYLIDELKELLPK
jgi:hypothetical protein